MSPHCEPYPHFVMNFPAKMQCWGKETYAWCGLAADGAHQDALEPASEPSRSASKLSTPSVPPLWVWGRAHVSGKPFSTDSALALGSGPVGTTVQQAVGSCWTESEQEEGQKPRWKSSRAGQLSIHLQRISRGGCRGRPKSAAGFVISQSI